MWDHKKVILATDAEVDKSRMENLINPKKKVVVEEIKDVLNEPNKIEDTTEVVEEIPELEEIQKNLFNGLDSTDKKDEWQRRFKSFIELRKIQEEDRPIVAELYTYPNDEFILWFHNGISFDQERFGENLRRSMPRYTQERPELKRFFELFLLFFDKYGWDATNHLNRVMENKKEWKLGLHPS